MCDVSPKLLIPRRECRPQLRNRVVTGKGLWTIRTNTSRQRRTFGLVQSCPVDFKRSHFHMPANMEQFASIKRLHQFLQKSYKTSKETKCWKNEVKSELTINPAQGSVSCLLNISAGFVAQIFSCTALSKLQTVC